MSTRTLSRRLVSLTLTVGMLLSAVAHAARDLPDFTRLVESQGDDPGAASCIEHHCLGADIEVQGL